MLRSFMRHAGWRVSVLLLWMQQNQDLFVKSHHLGSTAYAVARNIASHSDAVVQRILRQIWLAVRQIDPCT